MPVPHPARDARRGPGRPRRADAEERILAAALEEYGERGWAGFTMDAVARRAGVGKSTIYLRWRDKDGLLLAAVDSRSAGLDDVDTGSFREDLVALATNLQRHLLDPVGWATLRLSVDATAAPAELGAFGARVAERHTEAVGRIVERASARGEVTAQVPVATLALCLYGAVTMQTLLHSGDRRELADTEVRERTEHLVDFVLAGAGAD